MLAETGKITRSMKDSTKSEHSEVIHELRMKSISLHGSLSDRDTSLGKAKLSLDRGESQVMRLKETGNDSQDAEEFEDHEPAICDVSGQIFECVFNRSQVSEAVSTGRFFVKPHDFGTTNWRNFVDPATRGPSASKIC